MAKAKTQKKAAPKEVTVKEVTVKEVTAKEVSSKEVTMDRRGKERRSKDGQRTTEAKVEVEQRQAPRRKVARRRQIDPTTCERDYNQDEIEFMHAMDAYKRSAGRMFPTCSEILEVLRDLGYRRLNSEQLALLDPPVSVAEVASMSVDDMDVNDFLDSDDDDDL